MRKYRWTQLLFLLWIVLFIISIVRGELYAAHWYAVPCLVVEMPNAPILNDYIFSDTPPIQ